MTERNASTDERKGQKIELALAEILTLVDK